MRTTSAGTRRILGAKSLRADESFRYTPGALPKGVAVAAGTRLGAYEILSLIGAGGMGEVYRARDRKLDREVAIKVLPEALATDPERIARFEREAKTLAALNQPHIAQIYGFEESGGHRALVMELVEGPTLADRIAHRPMALEDVLPIAKQITEALEAAHEQGIIHRDLKPANIKVRDDGIAKVLDFGLAKAFDPGAASNAGATISPTLSMHATHAGIILGTAAYMAPEQARGRPVDKRADVWAFGCVLFEMLAGRRAFEGDDVSTTLAAVLKSDPEWSALPSATSPRLRHLLHRCLQKDPKERLRDIGEARIVIGDMLSGAVVDPVPAAARQTSRWQRAAIPAAMLLIGSVTTAALLGSWWPRGKSAPPALRQMTFDAGIARDPALSFDGKLLAYVSDRAGGGQLDIWLKQMAGGEPLRLTSTPSSKSNPQFSPDGTKIYYLADGAIFDVPALGGIPRRIVERGGPFAVSSRGEIAFYRPRTGTSPAPISILPAGGGTAEPWHVECLCDGSPAWSPAGDRILFAGECGNRQWAAGAYFGLDVVYIGPRHDGAIQRLWEAPLFGLGRIAWLHLPDGTDGVMLPVPAGDSINLYRTTIDGTSEPVTQGTGSETSPAISPSGEVVFARGEETPAIWSLPLEDTHEPPAREATPARIFATSADGRKLVYGRYLGARRGELVMRDRMTGSESVLAVHDIEGRFSGSMWPQVSPDGSQVIYRVTTNQIAHYLVSTDGGEPRRLTNTGTFNLASDWSPDGRRVIGECGGTDPRAASVSSIGICDLDPTNGATRVLLTDPQGGELLYPSFSPDGKWVSFMRRRAGRTVVCTAPVRDDGRLAGEAEWIQISSDNAEALRPRFTPDGSALFYEVRKAGMLMLVKQKLDPTTKRPSGDVSTVTRVEFSGYGQSIITVTRDRVFFNTDEVRSNIWMTRLQ